MSFKYRIFKTMKKLSGGVTSLKKNVQDPGFEEIHN